MEQGVAATCRHCTKPAAPGLKLCTKCRENARACHKLRAELGLTAGNYEPIDEVLSSPAVRIMRALRHFDGISCFDLFEVMGVPPHNGGHDHERDAHTQALCRLRKMGLIERLEFSGHAVDGEGFNWYRVTDAGRKWLADRLKPDTKVIWTEKYEPRKSA